MKNDKSYSKLLEQIAKRIQKVRYERKLTQESLAELAGFNYRHYQKIESGTYSPNLETLHRLATALKANIRDFFP